MQWMKNLNKVQITDSSHFENFLDNIKYSAKLSKSQEKDRKIRLFKSSLLSPTQEVTTPNSSNVSWRLTQNKFSQSSHCNEGSSFAFNRIKKSSELPNSKQAIKNRILKLFSKESLKRIK